MSKRLKNAALWWKQFDGPGDALIDLILEGFQYDFKSQRERLQGWRFNQNKFKDTMSEKQKSDFVFWISEIEKKGDKI